MKNLYLRLRNNKIISVILSIVFMIVIFNTNLTHAYAKEGTKVDGTAFFVLYFGDNIALVPDMMELDESGHLNRIVGGLPLSSDTSFLITDEGICDFPVQYRFADQEIVVGTIVLADNFDLSIYEGNAVGDVSENDLQQLNYVSVSDSYPNNLYSEYPSGNPHYFSFNYTGNGEYTYTARVSANGNVSEKEFTLAITNIDNDYPELTGLTTTTADDTVMIQISSSEDGIYRILKKNGNDWTPASEWRNVSFPTTLTSNGTYAIQLSDYAISVADLWDYMNWLEEEADEDEYECFSENPYSDAFLAHIVSYTDNPFVISCFDSTNPVINNVQILTHNGASYVYIDATDESGIKSITVDKPAEDLLSGLFKITTKDTYTFTVKDMSNNTATVSKLIDPTADTVTSGVSIVPVGKSYTSGNNTYSLGGYVFNVEISDNADVFADGIAITNGATAEPDREYEIEVLPKNTRFQQYIHERYKLKSGYIDKDAPTVSGRLSTDKKTYTLHITDNGSGVGKVYVKEGTEINELDFGSGRKASADMTIAVKDNLSYEVYATDNLGNMSKTIKFEGNKDKYFKVIFYDSNNKVLSEQKIKQGESATAPSAPERKGYTFKGWDGDYTNVQKDLSIRPVYNKSVTNTTIFGQNPNEKKQTHPSDSDKLFEYTLTGKISEEPTENTNNTESESSQPLLESRVLENAKSEEKITQNQNVKDNKASETVGTVTTSEPKKQIKQISSSVLWAIGGVGVIAITGFVAYSIYKKRKNNG